MSPDRPGRRPGPDRYPPPRSVWDGDWEPDLTDRADLGRGPGPEPEEVHHLRPGEWAQLQNGAEATRGQAAPTRAERFYLDGGDRPQGRGGVKNSGGRQAPTRIERVPPGGGPGPVGGGGARNPRGRHAPTRVERFSSGGGPGPGGGGRPRSPRGRHAPTRAERFFGNGQGPGRLPGGTNWEAEESDAGLHARQVAGINALISIANIDTGVYERQVEGIRALISIANEVAVATRTRETISSPTGEIRKVSRLSVLAKLRQDELTWNSLFLVLNTGLQSGTGFLFWIITARLFSVSDVGKGSALISGVSLIGTFALLGLNMGMGRYLPNAPNRDSLISSGLAMVATVGALGGIIYILLTPYVAPDLAFVGKSPALMITFAIITSAFAINTLTDNIFIASRKAKYTVFVDGVIGGIGKVALAFVVTGAGAFGLFLASSIATGFAAFASLLLIILAMRVRVDLRQPLRALKPLLRFAGANYIANIINTVAGLVVPIILLDRLGPESAAYFFVVFQMAQIVYTAGVALEQTFLTEGSRADADMRQLRRRSLRLLVVFFVSAAVIMIGLGRFVLLAFGPAYYQHGYTILIFLVLAAGPISANYWLMTILRLAGKLRAIIVVNAAGSIATCLGVWFGSAHGLSAVGAGWLIGNVIEMCIAAIAAQERRAR